MGEGRDRRREDGRGQVWVDYPLFSEVFGYGRFGYRDGVHWLGRTMVTGIMVVSVLGDIRNCRR